MKNLESKNVVHRFHWTDALGILIAEKQYFLKPFIKGQHKLLSATTIKIFKYSKDIDICVLELREDVIEAGRINNLLLRSICLPDEESIPGSSCFTSGINKDSKIIDAVPLNLFNNTFCDDHSIYNEYGTTLNKNQLCAGLPSNTKTTAAFNGQYKEDLGGPLICIDSISKKPIFTGVTSSNSLSTKSGYPGMIHIHLLYT